MDKYGAISDSKHGRARFTRVAGVPLYGKRELYIDPPYNTRAKDWKYNNDYVDPGDQYRHSKWLSMKEYHVLPILQEAHGGQFINLALVDGGAGRRSRNHPEFS